VNFFKYRTFRTTTEICNLSLGAVGAAEGSRAAGTRAPGGRRTHSTQPKSSVNTSKCR